MATAVPVPPESLSILQQRVKTGAIGWPRPLLMTVLRLVLFASLQALLALGLALAGNAAPWRSASAGWAVIVVPANLITVALLVLFLRREGGRYADFWKFNRSTLGRDLLTVLGLALLAGPIGFFPNLLLSGWLFGDPNAANGMLIMRLPLWAGIFQLAFFPLTQAFAELPAYFGYAMPRIEALSGKPWLAVGLTGLFLGLQHATLPLVFDARFLLWRGLEFMPFAFFMALVIRWRPRLLPYFMIFHALIDISAAYFVFAGPG